MDLGNLDKQMFQESFSLLLPTASLIPNAVHLTRQGTAPESLKAAFL